MLESIEDDKEVLLDECVRKFPGIAVRLASEQQHEIKPERFSLRKLIKPHLVDPVCLAHEALDPISYSRLPKASTHGEPNLHAVRPRALARCRPRNEAAKNLSREQLSLCHDATELSVSTKDLMLFERLPDSIRIEILCRHGSYP